VIAITQVWILAIDMISTPEFERTYSQANLSGIPYFFGICCFIFEGNTVTLEIYRKMENKRQDFTKALGFGLGLATIMFMLTGILFYNAFA
jgi:amino acid permease